MKAIIQLLLFSILFINTSCGQEASKIKSINAETLEKSDKKEIVILDVRTPEEFSEGHLSNAINIDYRANNFSSEIDKLNKDAHYIVYCRSGHRSSEASKLMNQKGFKKVENLDGGILDWQAKGYEVTK